VALAIAAAIPLFVWWTPPPGGLTPQGWRVILIILGAAVGWLLEPVPDFVTTLMMAAAWAPPGWLPRLHLRRLRELVVDSRPRRATLAAARSDRGSCFAHPLRCCAGSGQPRVDLALLLAGCSSPACTPRRRRRRIRRDDRHDRERDVGQQLLLQAAPCEDPTRGSGGVPFQ
jgi:hypothetical protein